MVKDKTDDLVEAFWEILVIAQSNDKERFLLKAKPLIKALAKNIKGGI